MGESDGEYPLSFEANLDDSDIEIGDNASGVADEVTWKLGDSSDGTFVDSDSDLGNTDGDSETIDLESDQDYESDISSVTDDGYLGGNDETGTILWRHINFRIVRNPRSGRPNILIAIISLVHTKGEDRKPRM